MKREGTVINYSKKIDIIAETSRGHVSNVKLIEYLDIGRQDWYRFCISLGVEAVVVHISANYKREVFNGDKLFVETELERIGNTSFTLLQKIINHKNELVVEAETVLTTINRKSRQKQSVPIELREVLKQKSQKIT